MSFQLADIDYMRTPKDVTEEALGMLEGVRLVRHTDDKNMTFEDRFSVVGQDLEKKVPYAVQRDGVNMLYVDPERLIPVLIGAINCLVAKNASDHGEIAALEARVATLEGKAPATAAKASAAPNKKATAAK